MEYPVICSAVYLRSTALWRPCIGEWLTPSGGVNAKGLCRWRTSPELEAYNINGSNYFKLRDLGDAVGFGVEFDQSTNSIHVSTGEEAATQPAIPPASGNGTATNSGINYPTGPVTLTEYMFGNLYAEHKIESFTITSVSDTYTQDLIKIEYEIIGTVNGSEFLDFDLKCYDKDGFLIESAFVLSSISDGERFKISESSYIPKNTVKIEFSVE